MHGGKKLLERRSDERFTYIVGELMEILPSSDDSDIGRRGLLAAAEGRHNKITP